MKQFIFFACILFILSASGKAQPVLKLDYFAKVPTNFKDCGALYTYDTATLEKKKYILLTDYQNLGLITINGKQVKLQLTGTKTIGKANILTYTGAGYTVVLTSTTTAKNGKRDIETGTVRVSSGAKKLMIKVHGQSGCDESKQEGNS